MAQAIPDYPVDLFSPQSVRDARAVDDTLREFAPVVRLADGNVMITRHAEVLAGLRDWQTYSSRSRPWHDAASVRPEILLTDDPPRHDHVRAVIARVLSAQFLAKLKESFERDAAALVDELLARDGATLDAVDDITRRFVNKVFPDAVGVRQEGREHMHAFGNMVWATMGPQNELFHQAMVDLDPVLAWIEQCCDRDRLAPGGIGLALYEIADTGTITQAEAKLLLQIVLSAGADTTILTMANAIRAFSQYPTEYQRLRDNPTLLRAAFDESLRWDSPSRMAGRVTTREVQIEDYVIPAGQRVGLMFAAANRDPRAWEQPDRYDLSRDLKQQVGWGYGVHACVGRILAQLESTALLSEFVRRVHHVEPAGAIEPWMTTIGHGPAHLPVRLHAD